MSVPPPAARAAVTASEVLAPLPPDADGPAVWAALGEAGLLHTAYRQGDPAGGVDPDGLATLLAAADERFAVGTTLSLCVALATALPLLATAGPAGPAHEVLAGALAGAPPVALAATDAGSGSDLTALTTEVRIGDDTVEVHGTKRWITGATSARHLLVLTRHRPGRHFTAFTWVLVPADAPGVTAQPADTALFNGSGTGHLTFDRVLLPRQYLAGRPGRGLADFAAHIAVERLAGALWGTALCARVLAETRQWLSGRTVLEEPLWERSVIRQRFAVCLVRVRELRALTRELAPRVAERHDVAAAALLKASAAATVDHVLSECAHFRGAEGFARSGAQWLRAQGALWGVGGGATEVVLSAVADSADTLLAELAP
ncbi:acyl-CoA dehydrogenase family protein [Streptomyces sp. JW3]|uniref:acyl-CoA dehydrogenase family protein n=1 Tax=Streptomyces sp. JW3 TaxID=3456955 RepID=UPI003FA4CE38